MIAPKGHLLRKAKLVQGKTLTFWDETVDDAEFFLTLCTDTEKLCYPS